MTISSFIQSMPKAELHVHLEGTMQPETVLALAKKHDMWDALPGQTIESLKDWFSYADFLHFLTVYVAISDLLRDADDFELLIYQCGADMAAQNIRYREVTFTPFTHTHYLDKGLTFGVILEGLSRGRARAKEDFGVEIRWIIDIPRNLGYLMNDRDIYDPFCSNKTLEFALMGMDEGVLALGLGGNEATSPPAPFAHAFEEAKLKGLKSTPHAGETAGPKSVWDALHLLQADRLGHGVRAMEDQSLVAELVKTQIPLEICPTSNDCLQVYKSMQDHPFRKLDEAGVFVTVNSDDPPLFNTSLVHEFQVLHDIFGYDRRGLARIARNAFAASFADLTLKTKLLDEFDAWVNEALE